VPNFEKHSLTPSHSDCIEEQERRTLHYLLTSDGSPWENGYCESFNSKLRDELLNGEIFTTLYEAQVLIENWRRHYNAVRPHSSLGYRPPAPRAILPPACGLPYAPPRSAYRLANAAGL
jgi:putative transposase